jgi:GNAT superfamily N-acetyltransferase
MSIDVRPIQDDELVPWLDAMSTGFSDRPDLLKVAEEVRPWWDLSRNWAAFEGGRIVGTFRSWAGELTVPGPAVVKATAITGVGVLPTHRRRGILSRMAATEHAAARARGEVVSILYASEYAIYGRFGYGPATTTATWTLDARATGFHPSLGNDGALVASRFQGPRDVEQLHPHSLTDVRRDRGSRVGQQPRQSLRRGASLGLDRGHPVHRPNEPPEGRVRVVGQGVEIVDDEDVPGQSLLPLLLDVIAGVAVDCSLVIAVDDDEALPDRTPGGPAPAKIR